jgi:hypothetical protein
MPERKTTVWEKQTLAEVLASSPPLQFRRYVHV